MTLEVSKIWVEWQNVIESSLMSEFITELMPEITASSSISSIPVSVQARSVAFSAAPTFAEYAANLSEHGPLLRQRLREVRLHPADQQFFNEYSDVLSVVAVVNGGMPDLTAMLPIWARICALCLQADLRVVTEDAAATTLSRLLNHGETEIELDNTELPQLFFFDEEWQFQTQWGPRPQAMESLLDEWLAAHPEYEQLFESDEPADQQRFAQLNDLLRLEMRVWCNSGMDRECAHEIRDLLAALQEQEEDDTANGT